MIYVNGSRAYCIQPGAALNTGSSLTQTTSSGVWASLSANQKEAVNVALCYGREGNFSNIKGSSSINSDQCYIATQLIIWEIVNGERSATAPFSLNGNGYLSMYCADGYNGNIANAYHKIENAMAAAQTVPSFATKTASDAPLYTLNATYNNVKRTWSYTPLTLTDSNSVMAQFAGFNNKTLDVGNATVTVSVSENKITLTPSAGKLNASGRAVSLSATKTGIPSSNEAKLIAYASSYQDVVSGGSASAPTAYFSVNVNIKQNANPSQSLQMVERALMTPDELKSLPKGDFIVMKTGVHPMRVHLKLFFKWGIEFDEDNPYIVPENGNRKVEYAEKQEIQNGIMQKYHPESVFDAPVPSEKVAGGSQAQEQTPVRETPKRDIPRRNTDSKKRGSGESPSLPELPEHSIQEVRSNSPS